MIEERYLPGGGLHMAGVSAIRPALVAGQFYEDDPERLRNQLRDCFLHRLGPGALPTLPGNSRKVRGIMCPHASIVYSGPQAARSFHRLALDGTPATAVILSPAHLVRGAPFAVWEEGEWLTPLGSVHVDSQSARDIIASHTAICSDRYPHLGRTGQAEHSIEVLLPFLQFVFAERTPSIVPIALSCHDIGTLINAGRALGSSLLSRNAIVVASCDLTHYTTHDDASRNDAEALDCIARMDSGALLDCINRHPTQSDVLVAIAAIEACKMMGPIRGEILGYSTSGDINGELNHVVGYGTAVFGEW